MFTLSAPMGWAVPTSLALALAGTTAEAMPPPVPVAPLVVPGEGELVHAVTELVRELATTGHYAATPAGPSLLPSACEVDDPERARCYAQAAREHGVPDLVYVIAEPAEAGARISCIGADDARSQQAELSIAAAAGSDEQAALRERNALAGCIIGALHAPRRE